MATVTIYDRNSSKMFQYNLENTDTIADVKKMISGENAHHACLTFHGKILNDGTPLGALGNGDVTLFIEKTIENEKNNRKQDDKEIEFSKIHEEEIMMGAIDCLNKENPVIAKDLVNAGMEEEHLDKVSDLKEAKISEILQNTGDETYKAIRIDGKEVKARASDIYVVDHKKYYITKRQRKFNLKYLQEKLESIFMNRTALLHFLVLLFIIQTNNIFLLVIILSIRALRLLSNICLRTKIWQKFTSHISKAVLLFFASLLLLDHGSFYLEKTD